MKSNHFLVSTFLFIVLGFFITSCQEAQQVTPVQAIEEVAADNNQSEKVTNKKTGSCIINGKRVTFDCPGDADCGCYEPTGLADNKRAYRNAGASLEFIASAMMETENMGTDYPYGDNKTGDSFNAGTCKQNWWMIRQAYSRYQSYGAQDYNKAAEMNRNRSLDIQVYNASKRYWGSRWFAGQRWGQTGTDGTLNAAQKKDLQKFKDAYDWTVKQLRKYQNEGVLTNGIRFWVQVDAV